MKEPNATKMFAFNLEQLAVLHHALHTELWKVQEEIDRREQFDKENPKVARAVREGEVQPKPYAHDRELLAIYLKVNGALEGPFNLSGEPDWVNEVMAQTFLASQRPKPVPVPQPKVAAKGKLASRAKRAKTSAANALARSERARQGGLARARKAAAAKAAQVPPGPPAPPVPPVEQVG